MAHRARLRPTGSVCGKSILLMTGDTMSELTVVGIIYGGIALDDFEAARYWLAISRDLDSWLIRNSLSGSATRDVRRSGIACASTLLSATPHSGLADSAAVFIALKNLHCALQPSIVLVHAAQEPHPSPQLVFRW